MRQRKVITGHLWNRVYNNLGGYPPFFLAQAFYVNVNSFSYLEMVIREASWIRSDSSF